MAIPAIDLPSRLCHSVNGSSRLGMSKRGNWSNFHRKGMRFSGMTIRRIQISDDELKLLERLLEANAWDHLDSYQMAITPRPEGYDFTPDDLATFNRIRIRLALIRHSEPVSEPKEATHNSDPHK